MSIPTATIMANLENGKVMHDVRIDGFTRFSRPRTTNKVEDYSGSGQKSNAKIDAFFSLPLAGRTPRFSQAAAGQRNTFSGIVLEMRNIPLHAKYLL